MEETNSLKSYEKFLFFVLVCPSLCNLKSIQNKPRSCSEVGCVQPKDKVSVIDPVFAGFGNCKVIKKDCFGVNMAMAWVKSMVLL